MEVSIQLSGMYILVESKYGYIIMSFSEVSVILNQQETLTTAVRELATFKVTSLEVELVQRTFDMNVGLLLGSVHLTQNRNDKIIDIISTPTQAGNDECLFKVTFIQVKPHFLVLVLRKRSMYILTRLIRNHQNFTPLIAPVKQVLVLTLASSVLFCIKKGCCL